MQHDLRVLQGHMNRFRLRMLRFDLLEQPQRRRSVDGLGKVRHGFQHVDVDRIVALFVQTQDMLPTAVRLRLLVRASTNPTVRNSKEINSAFPSSPRRRPYWFFGRQASLDLLHRFY